MTLKSRPILALLLVATATLLVAARAGAETFPGSLKQIGTWTLVANASSRAFHSCSMRRVQSDGFAIFIGLTGGGAHYFGTSAPRWDLKVRQTYPMSLKVGSRQFTFTGTGISDDTLTVDAGPDFFAVLQSGQTLSIAANQRHFAMDLEGIEAATAALRECATNYNGRTVPVAMPAPRPPGTSATRPKTASNANALVIRVPAKPVYPELSIIAREEGKVMVKVTFDAKGIPEVIYVESSSGYPALDKSATDAVQRMRIEPRVVDGQSSPITVVLPIQFLLASPAEIQPPR